MHAPKERERERERGKAREQKVNMKEKEEEWSYGGGGSQWRREYIKGKSPLGVILTNAFLFNHP